MNSMSEQARIDDARNKYLTGDVYWAADLMFQLENQMQGKSLLWAIECVKSVIETAGLEKTPDLLRYLNELASQVNAKPNPEWLREKGTQIWNEPRDIYLTAISHLYGLYVFSRTEVCRYRGTIISALMLSGAMKLRDGMAAQHYSRSMSHLVGCTPLNGATLDVAVVRYPDRGVPASGVSGSMRSN